MPAAIARKRQTSREAILSTAEAAFAEHGFSGARVDDIAESSGFNKTLIFRHFGDKLGLYAEVLKHVDEGIGSLQARSLAPLLQTENLTTTGEAPAASQGDGGNDVRLHGRAPSYVESPELGDRGGLENVRQNSDTVSDKRTGPNRGHLSQGLSVRFAQVGLSPFDTDVVGFPDMRLLPGQPASLSSARF